MSETSPPYSTDANPEPTHLVTPSGVWVPYAEQQIRALCLIAAILAAGRFHQLEGTHLTDTACDWRKFIAEGNWDA